MDVLARIRGAARGMPAALLLAGCTMLPGKSELPLDAPPQADAQRTALLASIEHAGDRALIERLDAIESRITGRPLVAGNRATLLVDGGETHAAQLEAIHAARDHIHIEMYTVGEGELARRYADALSERRAAGVDIRILYDSLGTGFASGAFVDRLVRAGVEVREYNPVSPLEEPRLWRMNRRNHRKLLIVDGRVAFTGGVNISDVYASTSSRSASSGGDAEGGWRDTHVRIEGPAVAEFQKIFVESWNLAAAPQPPVVGALHKALQPVLPKAQALDAEPRLFPEVAPAGDDRVRVVTSEGVDAVTALTGTGWQVIRALTGRPEKPGQFDIYKIYLAAILLARERIWITQAYFAPNEEFLDALRDAARRGVEVRVIVPGESDVDLLVHASRSQYEDLLEAGVRIHEYDAAIMHAKTAVIDGVWSTVGSSNLDYRSFLHNDEANAIVVGTSFGREMERLFRRDLEDAREIRLEEWRERSWWQRLREQAAVLVKYWL